jgi:hypothetical protein
MKGLLSETVNHKPSAEGITLWVPTLIERWRSHFDMIRPHSSLGYRPPTTGRGSKFASPIPSVVPYTLIRPA